MCNSQEEVHNKSFKFLNFWTGHHQFITVVTDNWKVDFVGDPFSMFHAKLKKDKATLSNWSKQAFGNIFQRVANLEKKVKVMEI